MVPHLLNGHEGSIQERRSLSLDAWLDTEDTMMNPLREGDGTKEA